MLDVHHNLHVSTQFNKKGKNQVIEKQQMYKSILIDFLEGIKQK